MATNIAHLPTNNRRSHQNALTRGQAKNPSTVKPIHQVSAHRAVRSQSALDSRVIATSPVSGSMRDRERDTRILSSDEIERYKPRLNPMRATNARRVLRGRRK